LFDITLEDAFAKVNGSGGVALLPFAVFPDIHENGVWIFCQTLSRFVDGNFTHIFAGVVDHFEKSRRMVHGKPTLIR
jgi:hypothetical protein